MIEPLYEDEQPVVVVGPRKMCAECCEEAIETSKAAVVGLRKFGKSISAFITAFTSVYESKP